MSTRSNSAFEEYRKTCSIIFGKVTASQLQYLSASIELQQSLLTSCDSVVANQLNSLEEYVRENKGSNLFVEPFLRIYSSMVDLCMTWISTSYDSGTLNIQSYRVRLENYYRCGFGGIRTAHVHGFCTCSILVYSVHILRSKCLLALASLLRLNDKVNGGYDSRPMPSLSPSRLCGSGGNTEKSL